jgi:hypothetical protein
MGPLMEGVVISCRCKCPRLRITKLIAAKYRYNYGFGGSVGISSLEHIPSCNK